MRFVTTEAHFAAALACVSAAVDVHAELPSNVFRKPGAQTYFLEYDHIFGREFWAWIAESARARGDDAFAALVIEPGATAYRQFGYFGAILASVDDSPDDYWRLMRRDPPDSADSIQTGAMVIAFVSSSGMVAAWADRHLELCIVAVRGSQNAIRQPPPPGFALWSPDDVLDGMRNLFRDRELPEDLKAEFLKNYR